MIVSSVFQNYICILFSSPTSVRTIGQVLEMEFCNYIIAKSEKVLKVTKSIHIDHISHVTQVRLRISRECLPMEEDSCDTQDSMDASLTCVRHVSLPSDSLIIYNKCFSYPAVSYTSWGFPFSAGSKSVSAARYKRTGKNETKNHSPPTGGMILLSRFRADCYEDFRE